MNNKILVTIKVPMLEKAYDIYVPISKNVKVVKELLNEYGKFPLANRYFGEMAKGKYLDGVKSAGWKLMMWGFSLLMHMRAYSLLAFGIKCLIDFRIDEILSDTGLKRQKNK